MSKIRKDGDFDERHKGARELNQAKGFFGGIFGILAILKGRRDLKNINKRINKRKNNDDRFKKAWDDFTK